MTLQEQLKEFIVAAKLKRELPRNHSRTNGVQEGDYYLTEFEEKNPLKGGRMEKFLRIDFALEGTQTIGCYKIFDTI